MPDKPKGNYGTHEEAGYADPGYQADKKPRYPLKEGEKLSPERVRAAWNYIHHEEASAQYSPDDLAKIKKQIVSAWRECIDKGGPPSMMQAYTRVAFTLGADMGGNVPDYIQMLPPGLVEPKGKQKFTVDGEARTDIMDAYGQNKTDLAIDYEHQSLSGSEAPAAGWIEGIENRGDGPGGGIWAKVRWTDRAKTYLRNREYRYISPVVLIKKATGKVVELLGAALTNLPAIDGMEPVVGVMFAPV